MVLVCVPVLLLGLGACSSGLSLAEEDACNAIHAWSTGGRETDHFDKMVALAQEGLEDSDQGSLITAADELADSAEADRVATATDFIGLCSDLGWELPEG